MATHQKPDCGQIENAAGLSDENDAGPKENGGF
jgi:hypothetical protein